MARRYGYMAMMYYAESQLSTYSRIGLANDVYMSVQCLMKFMYRECVNAYGLDSAVMKSGSVKKELDELKSVCDVPDTLYTKWDFIDKVFKHTRNTERFSICTFAERDELLKALDVFVDWAFYRMTDDMRKQLVGEFGIGFTKWRTLNNRDFKELIITWANRDYQNDGTK